LLLLSSRPVAAQSTGGIAGSAKDSSGGVLPGVTVEAASPALIERVRSVVTDDKGEYKIVDLPPGTYSVKFSLAGFGTFTREGIQLSAGFTAAVNGDMKVGSIQESITVSGAAPIVDVQNARTQSVLKADVMAALPSGNKDLMAYAALTLGATSSVAGRNDVGGAQGEQNTSIVLHGGRGDDARMNWDGMNTGFGNLGGQQRIYKFNTIGVQEVVVDAGGNVAESETGAANVNMVPQDGGNRFKLMSIVNYTTQNLASGQVPDDLIARGSAPNQNAVKKVYDYGLGFGGPFLKDKLWFYTANRWWGSQAFGANNYFNRSTNPLFYVADLSRPAYSSTYYRDNAIRLTWQAATKHKMTFEEHNEYGCNCWLNISGGGLTSPEATTSFHYGPMYLTQSTWSYPATNRLLFQAGASFLRQIYVTNRTAIDEAGTIPTGPNITELSTGYAYGALSTYVATPNNYNNYNQRASVSYITGSHAVKVGLLTLQSHADGYSDNYLGVAYTFRNQLPVSLTEFATPSASLVRIRNLGLYAQDQWTVKRLTLNYGVRFDHYWAFTPAFTRPAGKFTPDIPVPALDNIPNFKDISPRVGVVYDLFGNGKTAIKGSFGRYIQGGAGMTTTVAPAAAIVLSTTRTWNDANGNFVPDCVLTNPATNGECGAISNTAFGKSVPNITVSPEAAEGWGKREYNYQVSAQLQHELRPGFSLAVGYFRTWWGNFTAIQNTAVSPSDFTQYCITAPTDTRLAEFSGQQICGLYDVNPNKFGQVTRVITRASNFGTQQEIFNGVDMGFNARFGKGALLQGGLTLGVETTDNCYANAFPNITPQNSVSPTNSVPRISAFCHVSQPLWDGVGSQAKLQAIYPLPWDFQVSGVYKNLPGIAVTSNLVATNAQIAPSLGRSLSSCPAAGACTATATIPILPYGTNGGTSSSLQTASIFDTRLNETDLRLSRTFRLGKARLQGTLDLYNVFNQRVAQAINTTYGAAWLRPTAILGGRLVKFGAQVDF
jgi:hypothetical protein